MEAIRRKISDLANETASGYGLEVVDIEISGNVRKAQVRVFIDRENGVTLDDCEKFSRALSAVLDVEDPIQSAYVLEVSSPGLDRPLRKPGDYLRNIGKLCRIHTRESIDGKNDFLGRIIQVEGDYVVLSMDDTGQITVPFDAIAKARLEIEFK